MGVGNGPELLLINAAQLATCSNGDLSHPLRGEGQADAGVIENGAIAVSQGVITDIGTTDEVLSRNRPVEGHTDVIDASGRLVVPGFVDAHTHLVYAGSRHREHAMRLSGARYLDILAAGGGILSTLEATRAASSDELARLARARLGRMLTHGTTTVEAKSGYGLDIDTELRQLKASIDASEGLGIEVVPTFMGAHAVPPEFAGNTEEYVDYVCNQVIPAVAAQGIAENCDVFCEDGVFTVEQSRTVLNIGASYGMRAKIHADEINPLGGAELAAEVHAISADHLAAASRHGMERMAEAGVVAVLLPATMFTLMSEAYADARAMIDRGVPVALATDFNPGTSPTLSMPFVITLACLHMKMTPQEALVAATRNAAFAVGRGASAGVLAPGRPATFVVCDVPHIDALPFYIGMNPVTDVVSMGFRLS